MNKLTDINQWLEKTIIELNLCPFAKEPFLKKSLRINICEENINSFNIYSFKDQIKQLETESIETILWVFSNLQINYLDFNDLSLEFEEQLEQLNLEDKYQLVIFHPDFYFGGVHPSDKANWVNRSPLPLIHILRKDSLDKAMASEEVAKNLSLLNEKKIKALSKDELEYYFWYLL